MSIFKLHSIDGEARAGIISTPHGEVPTPTFMSVATQGSVKALDPADLQGIGSTILLANAYHIFLRPGVNTIESLGGLHEFMGWDGPILTDSGGFQGYSLKHLRKITEDAIIFKSHIDGTLHSFSPETSIQCQEKLGADIIMPLDLCVPNNSDKSTVKDAVELTTRWAERCRNAHVNDHQYLFGIIQGGLFTDLRHLSTESLLSLGFPGYAIGGLSVGETKSEMYRITEFTTQLIPRDLPRYLMGVGSPEDLVECVARGVDTFDCVLPTRIARNGALFTKEGRANIYTARFKNMEDPIDPSCDCYTCTTFSAAYVHHLFKAKELLAYRLASLHNLRFVYRLMEELRSAIIKGNFEEYRRDFLERFIPPNEHIRQEQKKKWLMSRRTT